MRVSLGAVRARVRVRERLRAVGTGLLLAACLALTLLPERGAQAESPAAALKLAQTVAQSPTQEQKPRTEKLVARDWILRMQSAASRVNFEGVLVYSSGAGSSSSRVLHLSLEGQDYEMLEALDGRQHRMLRHNQLVHMQSPQSKMVVIEKRETLAAWSTTPQRLDALALDQYALQHLGGGRVAGREALIFQLQPRDGLRYGQRLWADRETALMLRADVLAPAVAGAGAGAVAGAGAGAAPEGPVLESTAFSTLELNVQPQPQRVLQAMQVPAGWREVRPQQRLTELAAQGWALARPVPGFRLAGTLLRGTDAAGGRAPLLHAVFTDGLALVSLFVEAFDEAVHQGTAQGQQGATSSLTMRQGDFWFTVVGDVPAPTLKLFALALEKRSP